MEISKRSGQKKIFFELPVNLLDNLRSVLECGSSIFEAFGIRKEFFEALKALNDYAIRNACFFNLKENLLLATCVQVYSSISRYDVDSSRYFFFLRCAFGFFFFISRSFPD